MNKPKFRCFRCSSLKIRIFKLRHFDDSIKCIGICYNCGRRKELFNKYLVLAEKFFDSKDAAELKKAKDVNYHKYLFENKTKNQALS